MLYRTDIQRGFTGCLEHKLVIGKITQRQCHHGNDNKVEFLADLRGDGLRANDVAFAFKPLRGEFFE